LRHAPRRKRPAERSRLADEEAERAEQEVRAVREEKERVRKALREQGWMVPTNEDMSDNCAGLVAAWPRLS
jgi:hypothetical protein